MSRFFIDKEYQQQRAEAVAHWRMALQREMAVFRVLRPIPSLNSLLPLEHQQAHIIAASVANLARPKEIARRERPSVFISRLAGLSATQLLFPMGIPNDLFPLLKEELSQIHNKMPLGSRGGRGHFTFGAAFTELEQPSKKFEGVSRETQLELVRIGQEKGARIFLHTLYWQGSPTAQRGRTDAYAWNGTVLKLCRKKVGGWKS